MIPHQDLAKAERLKMFCNTDPPLIRRTFFCARLVTIKNEARMMHLISNGDKFFQEKNVLASPENKKELLDNDYYYLPLPKRYSPAPQSHRYCIIHIERE